MKDTKVTVDQIMALEPCSTYPRERVESLIGDGKTLLEICDGNIPAQNRWWVVVQLLPPREQRLCACACARRVLPIYNTEHSVGASIASAIDIAEHYAEEKCDKAELHKAFIIAYKAARLAKGNTAATAAEAILSATKLGKWEILDGAWYAAHAATDTAVKASCVTKWIKEYDKIWDIQLSWLRARLIDGNWYAQM